MKFVLTCGGTAGHINPAIAVAGRLRELMPDCGILFIGAKDHMETELVPREGYDIRTLTVTNLSRGHNLEAVKHNIETIKKSIKWVMKKYKPDASKFDFTYSMSSESSIDIDILKHLNKLPQQSL